MVYIVYIVDSTTHKAPCVKGKLNGKWPVFTRFLHFFFFFPKNTWDSRPIFFTFRGICGQNLLLCKHTQWSILQTNLIFQLLKKDTFFLLIWCYFNFSVVKSITFIFLYIKKPPANYSQKLPLIPVNYFQLSKGWRCRPFKQGTFECETWIRPSIRPF